jgi:hypothetical protein
MAASKGNCAEVMAEIIVNIQKVKSNCGEDSAHMKVKLRLGQFKVEVGVVSRVGQL